MKLNWEKLTAEQIEEMRFQQRLNRSGKACAAIAAYLERQGWQTHVPPQGFVDRKIFKDKGDLYFWKEPSERHRGEVKWRGIDFTCEDDFPYRDFNVDRVSKRGIAFMYASTNYDLTHAALIYATSRPQWRVELSTDKLRGYKPFEVYRCSLEYVEFVSLLPPPPPLTNTFCGRCHCGDPGLYWVSGSWFCNQHRTV